MTRVIELLLAALAALLLLPVMLVAALAILLSMGRPILFRHRRAGRYERIFTLYKFRTMKPGTAPDAERLTRLGRLLRAASLDELPQLWNVLRGEMSLVGPRPLLPDYLPRYSPSQRRRHAVRPGLTGWAQVHGRNALTWEQKFDLDLWYVDHRSLRLDLKILGLTLLAVVRRDGISQAGHATMPEFTGSVHEG